MVDSEKKKLTSEKPQKLDIHFSKRRLFVIGFDLGTTEQELRDYFSRFGIVEDVSLFSQKRYAFVTFECFYKFPPNHNNFNGKSIEVHTLEPRCKPDLKTKTILVNGILADIPNRSMTQYFSRYGKVKEVNMLKTKEGHKRFAFVIFDRQESVEKAIETPCHLIDGKLVDIRKARENPLYGMP